MFQSGKSDFAGSFEVQSYQLEPIDLTFDLKTTVYYRGETIAADLVARYQYGAPVANRPIDVELPDGRILHAQTDTAGKYHLEFPDRRFRRGTSPRYHRPASPGQCGGGGASPAGDSRLRNRADHSRDVYLDGESFQLQALTLDARGEPTGQKLSASLLKLVESRGTITEREVQRNPLDD